MNITRARRFVQIGSLAFLIAIPLLNKHGIDFISGSLYSLAVGPVWITDPLIGLQTVLLSLSVDAGLLASLIVPIVLALLLGRVFCSWVCPQNLLSELVDGIASAEGLQRPVRQSRSVLPRYAVLSCIIILTPFAGIPIASLLSAPGIISVQIAKYVYEGIVGLELGLIVLIVLAEFLVARRAWCAYLCPVGAFLGLFRTGKTLKVALDEEGEHACSRCGACSAACQFGLNPANEHASAICHNCGDCITACRATKGEAIPLVFTFRERK